VADNLTVTIGADSSKLRAELAIVSQATKAATKELNALAATFNKTGQSADRIALDAKARQLDQYKRSASSLNAEIAKLSPSFNRVGNSAEHAASGLQEFIHQGRGLGRVVSEFSSLTRSVESFGGIFGRITGGFAGGLFGVTIGKAFSLIRESIDEVSKALSELKKTADEIGIKPIALQAAQDVVKGLGEDADIATKAMQGMSAQLDEIRKKSTQPVATGGVSVLRGGVGGLAGVPGAPGVQVFRGGQQQPRDFGQPLEMLGIAQALKQLPNTEIGKLQAYTMQLQAFVAQAKNFDPTALNLISKTLFGGVPAASMLKVAPALLKEWQAQIVALEATQRGATDEAVEKNDELIASQNRLAKAWSGLMATIAEQARPGQIAINDMLAKLLDGTALAAFKEGWTQFCAQLATQSNSAWTAFLAGTQTAADGFKTIWQGALDWLSNATSTVIAAAKSAVASTAAAIGSAAASGVPFAAGGMVRGSGSGTSDSILARLSNGEFVMRAQAVQHWGPQLLASLNSLRNPGFALGGLVSAPHFAEGGPVSAGGTPVHLHLGGNSFALSGHDNVVNALVVEAHRQQMRSAGTKPSWFAARPSGR
jgi:hypothetical protein